MSSCSIFFPVSDNDLNSVHLKRLVGVPITVFSGIFVYLNDSKFGYESEGSPRIS
ncbi:MAG: hypothetical protein WBN56_00405 [Robiginitalea sp.]|uniref:hypothetical protein n=1 Tax=Robiginitalea sp. TaxID=1902411 RepID=UPI003C77C703